MTLRFLIDGQLPPALAARLGELGHDAVHIQDIGLGDAADTVIWRRAVRDGRIVVTKDEDFAAMAMQSGAATAVLWIRLGNVTNQALWAALRPVLPEMLAALEAGERLVEVRQIATQ